MTEAQNTWSSILEDLQLQMTRATYDTWLRGTRVVATEGDTWTVYVRHAYAMDWLNARLRPVIDRTVARHAPGIRVEFTATDPAPPVKWKNPEPLPDDPEPPPEPLLEAVHQQTVTHDTSGHVLTWTDFYIRIKLAFRETALGQMRGAPLSVFISLALHLDADGTTGPGIDRICKETRYGRTTVIAALNLLEHDIGIIEKLPRTRRDRCDRYRVLGYAWFGRKPAKALFEERMSSDSEPSPPD